MSVTLQQACLVITWSPKLQERVIPNVKMLFKSLFAPRLLLSYWPKKVSCPSPAALWPGTQGGEEFVPIFAIDDIIKDMP